MPKPVILFQDGAVDELMSVALLTTMREVDYLGCYVVNGDCLAWPTIQAQKKILRYLAALDTSLPTGTFVRPVGSRAVNAFPWTYRQYSMMTNLLPALNQGDPPPDEDISPGTPRERVDAMAAHVADIAAESGGSLTLLSLGPLTPIAEVIDRYGQDFVAQIDELVWMGGAIPPVGGNVDPGIAVGANPAAEWNAYWDPYAVQTVFTSGMPVTLFPLNVTNKYPLDARFFDRYIFPNQGHPLVDLAGQMYTTVAFEDGYCFWDTVTTAYLGRPSLFKLETKRLVIDTDWRSPTFGSITEAEHGAEVKVAKKAKGKKAFYHYYMDRLMSVGHSG